jgi:DNA-binding beta-propeller fold protein YncE
MYVLGTGTDGVLQYNLDTAYQPSTAALSGKSVTAQETQPEGVDFKTDGTKMYVMGPGKVSEYDLTTAWDVTTASFIQSTNVSGNVKVRFKDDGTKMYTMSNSADRVYQYSLSTPWDISTASYDLISLLVQPQEAFPEGFCFGDSGSKMYVVGTVADSVLQYSLSTPWDLSTASYSGISKSVSAQDLSPVDVFFKSDGTIMYVLGAQGSDINQYALSTAWDVSTASYTKVSSPNYETGTTYGIFVKPDGTKFYIVGSANDTVRQLTMPTAWDVANMVPGFYVGSQEGTPNGLAFKDDGTKMYVVGSGNDTVYQYSLSTAWDTLTASYDSVSFSVATQELIPQGITFKTDGTKMYIIGSDGDDVNEYNLSSAWNISTASYVQNFSVSAQTGTTPVKVEFSSDGTKMIVLSNTNGNVFQYNLSSAWNISTASYSSTSFTTGTATGDTNLTGLAFADSGTKMYTIGTTLDRVFAFPLSSGWTLSAITGNYKFVGGEDTEPRDVFFKTDGTIMYMLGGAGDDFNQYAVSTAWNLYSSSYTKVSSPSLNTWYGESAAAGMFISSDGKNVYACGTSVDTVFQQGALIAWDVATFAPGAFVGGQDLTPNGVAFKDDGTKMYVVGSTNDTVYQYSLSTAWNVLTASYDSVSFSVASQETEPRGITFKTDGTKMYIIGQTGDDVNEYNLGTAWNVSTASFVQLFSVLAQTGTAPVKVEFKSDGTKMFVASDTNDAIYEYALSSAWNISTASYSSISYAVGTITGETALQGLAFADSGTKMYIVGQTLDRVLGFPLSTALDLSTANSYYRLVQAEETNPQSVTFKPDGTEMYVLGTTGDDVNQYSVSTAWSVQSASYVRAFVVSGQTGTTPVKVQFKDDGTKMYVLSLTNDSIYQYSLSTAWNISTATYDSVSFSVTSQDTEPRGMFFGDSGTKLYIVGAITDNVYQYTLSSAWDLSTASYASKSFSVVSQEISPRTIFLGDSGSKMYVVGENADRVFQYNLSTPWDVSTASYSNKNFSVIPYESAPQSVWFKDDGTKFFVVGTDNDIVWEFTIS